MLIALAPAAQQTMDDSWTFTLDTLVAVLGATATIVVAIFALVQTHRANDRQREVGLAERELRERTQRFRLHESMTQFLEACVSRFPEAEINSMEATALENGFVRDCPEIEWVQRESENLRYLHSRVPRDDSGPLEQSSWLTFVARRHLVRKKLAHWVTTGEFDPAPLPDITYD